MIRRFGHTHRLSKYYFDTDRKCIMSTQRPGVPRPLTWSQSLSWYPKRVSMVNDQGYKVNYTESQIMGMLLPAESGVKVADRKAVAPAAITNDLSLLRPDFEYVLFSVKNKASQYFFKDTSIAEALARLAKRGEHVAVEDIRIVNTLTGKVSTLKPQVVTTYVLS